MLNTSFFEDLSSRITALLPMAGEVGDDIRSSIGQLLQRSFEELNLLTQEQFKSQTDALNRAELRIEELADEITLLEQKLELLSPHSN